MNKRKKRYAGIIISIILIFALGTSVMARSTSDEAGTAENAETTEPALDNPDEPDTSEPDDPNGLGDPDEPTEYNGFHQDEDGDWYYYIDGQKATGMTDVVQGTVNGTDGWWNVVNGKVVRAETVAYNIHGWWYISSSGMVDFSYNGFAQNSNGWWYIENGRVNFDKNTVIEDTGKKVDGTDSWWYVVGSQVQTGYTGVTNYKNEYGWWYVKNGKVDFTVNTVAKNNSGWWYVKNGKVDFTANTVANNANGWWYVKNGKVDFSYNGFAQNSNGLWYVENGQVKFNKNSVIKDTSGAWYYVVGSKVQTGYTGVSNYSNANGWWYIKNGAVDFSANTVAKNNNGWWYVTDGQVQFGFTGLANYSNENGWWYIKNGAVDFSASTVTKNNYGWWYVKNGKVDFSFNGLASNSNGQWVIQNGAVNFNYNGTYTYSGVTYNVTNGKASHPANSIGMSTTMYNKAQSQSSNTKWLVVVDISNCRVGIFDGSKGSWNPDKYWQCTTGKSSTPTITGSYTIYDKGKSFGDGSYTCWYYNRFYNGYMLHSVLYNPGSMTSIQDGRLGQHLSHGCVRLALDNAKWIYDNIPYGTKVYLY